MTRLELNPMEIPRDILDAQPMPKRNGRARDNWLPIAMFLAWCVGQLVSAGGWLHARETNEEDVSRMLQRLEKRMDDSDATYVRRDVLEQQLRRIEERVTSLDEQLRASRR